MINRPAAVVFLNPVFLDLQHPDGLVPLAVLLPVRELRTLMSEEHAQFANAPVAREVARRRRAGYDVPQNPLTDEAYVAQAAAHWDEVLKAGTEIYEQEYHYRRSREKSEALKVSIIDAIKEHPMLKPSALSRLLGKPKSTICKSIRELVASGALHRDEHTSQWLIVQNQV